MKLKQLISTSTFLALVGASALAYASSCLTEEYLYDVDTDGRELEAYVASGKRACLRADVLGVPMIVGCDDTAVFNQSEWVLEKTR